jgi:hypothetical protein
VYELNKNAHCWSWRTFGAEAHFFPDRSTRFTQGEREYN